MKNIAVIVASALTLALVLLTGSIDRASAQEQAERAAPAMRVAPPPPNTGAAKPAHTPTASPAPAQPALPGAALPPGYVRLYLVDGSILHGKMITPEFTLTTEFGALKIPAPLVTGMIPGLDSHPQIRARLNELVDDLGSGDEQKIGKATPELTRMGPEALAELTAIRARSKSEVVERSLQEVIDAIRETQADDADSDAPEPSTESWQSDDSMSTAKFTAVGKIQPQAVQLTTTFGDVTIKLADIKRISIVTPPGQETVANASVSIINGGQEAFKATGINIVPGDKLVFTAKGTLKMTPWDDSISATPDGESDSCGFAMPNIPQGALVGRIGSGPLFKIGSRFTMTADRSGPLKVGVAIEPTMWVNLSIRMKNGEAPAAIMTGQFDVRVLHQPKK